MRVGQHDTSSVQCNWLEVLALHCPSVRQNKIKCTSCSEELRILLRDDIAKERMTYRTRGERLEFLDRKVREDDVDDIGRCWGQQTSPHV